MNTKPLLVANDAGGANALISILKEEETYKAYATGPSVKILSKLQNVSLISEFELSEFSEIYIATSLHEKNWLRIVQTCNQRKINYYVVMDHWANFSERFIFLGRKIKPQNLITLDIHATMLAKKEFPDSNILQKQNLYLERLKLDVEIKRRNTSQNTYLYIGEYTDYFIADCGIYYEQKLFESLCKFFSRTTPFVNLVLRPHPSEKIDKYNYCQSLFPFKVSESTLVEDLAKASIVFGHDSHALFVAHECGIACQRVRLSRYSMDYFLPINLPSLLID